METTTGDMIDIEPGASVYGSDGEKLGAIMEVGPDYIVVEKGLFFPTDYFVPNGAIASVEPDRITLTLTRDEALEQGWDKDPTEHPDPPVDAAGSGGARTASEPAGRDRPGHGNDDQQPATGFAARTVNEPEESADRAGLATELGTVPPAADFATLGVAPIDVNPDYAEGETSPVGPAGDPEAREGTDDDTTSGRSDNNAARSATEPA